MGNALVFRLLGCCLLLLLLVPTAQAMKPDIYLLARDEDHCGNVTNYYVLKKDTSRRAAMALYQILHFSLAQNERLAGQEMHYKEQFGLEHLPNDVLISRWNQMSFLVPYTVVEMERAVSVKTPTNNPDGDIRSWFYSDLRPADEATIHRIIAVKKALDENGALDKTVDERWKREMHKALQPLLDFYGIVTATENGSSCD